MKKCPRCGHEIKKDAMFCSHCGLDLRGRYRPIHKKKGSPLLFLYIMIIVFSFAIPLLYDRLLGQISQNITQDPSTKITLEAVQDKEASLILGSFDSLEAFQKQFVNVDDMVKAIRHYEDELTKEGQYTFDKTYEIYVLDNNDVSFHLVYQTQIDENVTMTIDRLFDRSHSENQETITIQKVNALSFEDLFLSNETMEKIHAFTGEQKDIVQLMHQFESRKDEFEKKKETLGHYGIGNYQGQSSFVVHRKDKTYSSQLTYSLTPDEYIY